ncbi:lantibiotic dehydratase [Streptomyces sp. RerS4]|uniref:lantibiotic dehydratase n=1 Tax=Streptomyces sp. RerS4 TaxID=2942449 RepID=UPI00201CAE2D|nr:lantibiotic dehydratase [Streptomyces sp. RerS4]UQX00037.1 lantibiotic dehydratase family protein [Streptomyces sp. RerS4]
MRQPQQPSTVADAHTDGAADGYHVRSAPYALARFTVLAHPAQGPAAAEFRTLLARLNRIDAELLRTTGPLCDHLYDSRAGHPEDFHRDVVLPLRRALHNGREPRPALLERLDDLPHRVPLLATWLALRSRRAALLADLAPAAEGALADERAALAALCRAPALGKAVALTSGDLLRAVERAATGADDRRARKEEPTVLRYALRASTKTSPLSWFTAVGWGPLGSGGPTAPVPSWGATHLNEGPLRAIVKVNRTLTTALVVALLDAPHRRAVTPHRITSTARISDGRAAYFRDRTAFTGGRYLVADEDEVELPYGGPLRLLTERAIDTPLTLPELTGLLTTSLSTSPHGGAGGGHGAAGAFLERLREAGLLVPGDPVPPTACDPVGGIAAWLRRIAAPRTGEVDGAGDPDHADEVTRVADAERAERIALLGRMTATFADAPASDRPALLAGLSRRWRETLDDAGRPVPEVAAPLSVLSEDVVAPHPLSLDGFLDGADHKALAEVTALAELFDLGHLVRRVVRDRFVARYGRGGTCRHPWEFGAEVAEAWQTAGRIANLDAADRADFPTGADELALLRAEFTRTAAAGGDTAGAGEVTLPPALARSLGPRLPDWTLERPLSYSFFLQKAPSLDGARLCVNHVYGGWGRFTSRFLDTLDPHATAEVSRQIRRGLGPGARAAQIRPVGGFNANLHPLLVPDEIGPDRRWASIGEGELDLVHDVATDQVRLRLRSTGELLDVLYPGFLAPVLLPRRIGAHLADHPQGAVDFRPLLPRHLLDAPGGRVLSTPRLTHRHVVLRRRRWTLSSGVVERLRADLAAGGPVPAQAAAHWRALLDLPEQLFLHPVAPAPVGRDAEDFLRGLDRPKPHLVDLGNTLHLRCLHKWLSRHGDGAVLEEALPAPGGLAEPTHATELVLEVYRAGRPR